MQSILKYLKTDLFADKLRRAVFEIYAILSLISAVYLLSVASYRNALLSVGYFLLVLSLLVATEYFLGLKLGNVFLLTVLIVPVGGLLGTCYEFYMYIPFFDTFLHTVSGFIFAAFGYSVMERVLIRTDENSRRIASLIFAFAFSLALAVLWEMFEWGSTVFLSGDMQEDSIVNSIRSYFLSGSHNNALVLDGITETVIHHSGGTYVIDGYLDLGLQDTLVDMLVCVIGALVFLTLGIIDSGKCDGKLVTLFTPSLSYGSISSGETSEKSSI